MGLKIYCFGLVGCALSKAIRVLFLPTVILLGDTYELCEPTELIFLIGDILGENLSILRLMFS
jgi:hypothetical protein